MGSMNPSNPFGEPIWWCWWSDDPKENMGTTHDWIPTHSLKQAFMCLDQMGAWSMEYDGLGSFGVDVNINTSILHTQLTMAVCIACAIETGWVNNEIHT